MFRLNLKIILRNIWRHKFTSGIKLVGLVVGLSTVLLLVAYVSFELSFDRQGENADRVFRIHQVNLKEKKENIDVPLGLVEMLQQEIPEVEKGAQLGESESSVKTETQTFNEKVINTGKDFLSMFSPIIVAGQKDKLLQEPHTAVISESMAAKLFPKTDALGKTFLLDGRKEPVQIVAIMKDRPVNSHITGNILVPASISEKLNWRAYTSNSQYIMLKRGVSSTQVEEKLKPLYKKYAFPKNVSLKLMPLTKIHLYSHTDGEIEPNGNITYIYIFSVAAFLILLIAVVNFVNLTIAHSIKRGKEIGVKKVLGASVTQLRIQFLSESFIYFIVASFLVLLVTNDLLPLFASKLGLAIGFSDLVSPRILITCFGILILSALLAGLYPALIMAKLQPVKSLKGGQDTGSLNYNVKRFLMAFQFSISGLLLICTFLIYGQLKFISHKNIGFDKEQMLYTSFHIFNQDYPQLKTEIEAQKEVRSVGISSFSPGEYFGGSSSWTNDNDTTKYEMQHLYADVSFISTLNIKIEQGRSFSINDTIQRKDQALNPIMLNTAAVKMLGLHHPIDTVLRYGGLQGKVIGVVTDFNGMSLHNQVKPLSISLDPTSNAGFVYVKLNPGNANTALTLLNQIWKKHYPDTDANFRFMDQRIEHLYQSEFRMGAVFLSFAFISIFLCCMGLFGMVYFELDQRTKEIAVRKVLGASLQNLLQLLNSSFVKIVLISNVIIWPVAYYLVRAWLNTFYYRIDLSFTPFLYALLIGITLTMLTVSLQAIKTIRKSPVEALKYE